MRCASVGSANVMTPWWFTPEGRAFLADLRGIAADWFSEWFSDWHDAFGDYGRVVESRIRGGKPQDQSSDPVRRAFLMTQHPSYAGKAPSLRAVGTW